MFPILEFTCRTECGKHQRAVDMNYTILCCLTLNILVVGVGSANAEPPRVPFSQLEKDATTFVKKGGPYTYGGVGLIVKGGCIVLGGTEVRTHYYRKAGVKKGGGQIQVQVTTLPEHYSFIRHDFYGMLRAVMKERAQRTAGPESSGDSIDEWLFVEWTAASTSATAAAYLCYISLPDRPDMGFVAWYSEQREGPRVVLIRYNGRTGLPSQIIDNYLALYPTTVDPTHYAGDGWVREDLEKWMQVLRQEPPLEPMVMTMMQIWLHRYGHDSFDMSPLATKRDNPAEYRKAVEQVVARMQSWLDEQDAGKGSSEK